MMAGRVPYTATIRTAGGTQCSFMYQVQKEGNVGYLTTVCY